MIEAVPANRLGRPEEITTAVLWLCGDMVSILHLKILVFLCLIWVAFSNLFVIILNFEITLVNYI